MVQTLKFLLENGRWARNDDALHHYTIRSEYLVRNYNKQFYTCMSVYIYINKNIYIYIYYVYVCVCVSAFCLLQASLVLFQFATNRQHLTQFNLCKYTMLMYIYIYKIIKIEPSPPTLRKKNKLQLSNLPVSTHLKNISQNGKIFPK